MPSFLKYTPTYVSSNDLATVPIKNGRYIICRDSGYQYIDHNNTRIMITQIIPLEEDMDRSSMSSPINGRFYMVKETASLWFYNNDEWYCLCTGYTHPKSGITAGTYVKLTIDECGHATDGSTMLEISDGGTGAATLEGARNNLGITEDKQNTDTRLDSIELSIQNIMNQINDIRLSYSDGEFYMSNETTSTEDGES